MLNAANGPKCSQTVSPGHTLSVHFTEGCVMLVDGHAAIFGAPLRPHVRYRFRGRGIPVESASGCRLEIEGTYTLRLGLTDSAISEIHAYLQGLRMEAAAHGRDGPRVLITGQTDTGKSSLWLALANNAVGESARYAGSTPFGVAIVDADIGQQSVTVPGTISTVFVEDCIAIDDPFTNAMPLAFFFGDKTVTEKNFGRYLDLCANTKRCIEATCEARDDFKAGGIIVNTMGWVTGLGFDAVTELIDILQITDVIVTGSDVDLRDRLAHHTSSSVRRINVIDYRSPKSLFVRDRQTRTVARTSMVKSYFSGTLRTPMIPSRVVAAIADLVFLDAVTLEPSAPPIPLAVCAVSTAMKREDAAFANTAGFVVALDVGRSAISFLSPSPGPLPNRIILVSTTISIAPKDVPPL